MAEVSRSGSGPPATLSLTVHSLVEREATTSPKQSPEARRAQVSEGVLLSFVLYSRRGLHSLRAWRAASRTRPRVCWMPWLCACHAHSPWSRLLKSKPSSCWANEHDSCIGLGWSRRSHGSFLSCPSGWSFHQFSPFFRLNLHFFQQLVIITLLHFAFSATPFIHTVFILIQIHTEKNVSWLVGHTVFQALVRVLYSFSWINSCSPHNDLRR